MRKLASIQKITNLQPIEGKDRIELATILGWKVIVGKGEFKVNDLCVYIEYDTILPVRPEFEFLRSRCYSPKYNGFRIRNMKMGNVFSQGIVFEINILPDITEEQTPYKEGDDVTEILNIRKYDPQALAIMKRQPPKNPIIRFLFRFRFFKNLFLKKRTKRSFPSHLVSKTDETRIQTCPHIINDFAGAECYITEKLDGCSATYVWDKNRFMVCSRNHEVKDKHSHWWRIAETYNLKDALKKTNYAIQGEIFGPGVANGAGKNVYKLKAVDFRVFNVVNKKTRRRLSIHEMTDVCQGLGLLCVPIITWDYTLGDDDLEGLTHRAKGLSAIANVNREGIVIRDQMNEQHRIPQLGDHLSFKVVNQDYLLEHEI